MSRPRRTIRSLAGDQAGQANIEYVLVLCAFGLPLMALLGTLLSILVAHYQRVTFFETLPFP